MNSFDNTLLENIPKEIQLMIDEEILRYEKQLCIEAHKKVGLNCRRRCHICRINKGNINFNLDNKSHNCCTNCIKCKKYMTCQECNKSMENHNKAFNDHFGRNARSDEELLEMVYCNIDNFVTNNCVACDIPINIKKCVFCGINSNMHDTWIKAIHYSISGKKVIYFCNRFQCCYYGNSKIIDPSLTEFSNFGDYELIREKIRKDDLNLDDID